LGNVIRSKKHCIFNVIFLKFCLVSISILNFQYFTFKPSMGIVTSTILPLYYFSAHCLLAARRAQASDKHFEGPLVLEKTNFSCTKSLTI